MNAPCYNCQDRFFDPVTKKRCHNTCDKYARYHRERERILAEHHENVQFIQYMHDNIPRLKRATLNDMRAKRK